jgi:hypothetical protein
MEFDRPSPLLDVAQGRSVFADLTLVARPMLQGDNVPAPITSFEAGGFPPEILKEVWLYG